MADATPAEVAEDLDAYVLRPRSATRDDRGYVVLIDGPDPTPLGVSPVE